MTTAEIIAKLTDLQELRRMQEDLTAEIETLQDAIKQEMGEAETLTAGPFKVTYKTVTSTRLDTTALKKELPDIAARYSRSTTTRRFCVA